MEDAEQSPLGEQRHAHERAETHVPDVGTDDLAVVHFVEDHRTMLGRDAPGKSAADRYADPLAALLVQPDRGARVQHRPPSPSSSASRSVPEQDDRRLAFERLSHALENLPQEVIERQLEKGTCR